MPLAAASSTVVSLVPPATGTVTPIPFGPDFEAKVMTMLITSTRFARLIAGELTEEHFLDQQNRVIAHHAIAYVNRYRAVPDPKVLVHDLVAHDRRVTATEMPDYVRKIAEHVVRVVTDQRYVEDKLLEWAKNQALLQIMIDGPKLIAAGRSAEADRRWKKAMTIGEDNSGDPVEFFSTTEQRRIRREAVAAGTLKRGVSTGFPELDRHLHHKGWGRGEFSLVLAPTKRGKTMLMDLFYDSVQGWPKRRIHFHAFMLEVHDQLHKWRQEKPKQVDLIPALAEKLASEVTLICFDEFHVSDIADAMILGRLLSNCLDNGIVFVMTSNYAPDRLYPDGLQRQNFLPTIALIKDRMDITGARWGLDSAEAVLRLRALRTSGDFMEYWTFHERCEYERNHAARYAGGEVPRLLPPAQTARPRRGHLTLVN